MSKVSLAGNASGTGIFTIASPNSNVDRTQTLPDSSGTLINTGAIGVVTADMLASTLDLSSKTITLPPANAAMTRLASGTISSSTARLDIDLSAYSSYTCFKVFVRNILMVSDTQIWFDKMTGSGTVTGNWYGGATREGEGAIAQVEYNGQPHWYILGNTTQTTNDAGQYAGGIDATFMKTGTSNKWMGVANAVIRSGSGTAQNINTGAFDITTTALWGIRFAGGANIATLSYAVYGVNMP
jgi:hypothetical protein